MYQPWMKEGFLEEAASELVPEDKKAGGQRKGGSGKKGKHVLGKEHEAAHKVKELQEARWRGEEVGSTGREPMSHTGCLDFIPGPQASGSNMRCAL